VVARGFQAFRLARSAGDEGRAAVSIEREPLDRRVERQGERRAQRRAGKRVGERAGQRPTADVVAAAAEREQIGAEAGRFLGDKSAQASCSDAIGLA
jgi:hypothetical protein